MLQVPDWLFILLATISILLFIALGFCLCWCIVVKTTRKGYAKNRELQEQYFLTQATPLVKKDDKNYQYPNYMPYTIPTIVQSPRSKSSSPLHSTCSLNSRTAKYYADSYKHLDENSCRSEPVINRAHMLDERHLARNSLKNFSHHHRPCSQLTGSFKNSSLASSRSSLKSYHDDHADPDAPLSPLHAEEVYLHSSLAHDGNLGEQDFVAKDHVVSYDQEGECNEHEQAKGALLISLYYDLQASVLIVSIKKAMELFVPVEKEENLKVYVNFCIVPEDFFWQKTVAVTQTRSPVFDQTFHIPDVLHHKLRQYTLCFLVMNVTSFQETVIGKVMVPLSDLRADVVVDLCKELKPN